MTTLNRPGAHVRHIRRDLADLSSLKASADALRLDRLDAVVCNAGVLLDQPLRRETKDGHELMFATNHLGHFALTSWLTPLLTATPASRVVTTGSFTAKSENLDLDDLQSTRDYRPKRTYARSKFAQMLFGFELDRRRQHDAERDHSPRRRTRLPHPLTPASPPPNHRRTTVRPADRPPLAKQGGRCLARCPGRPRPVRARRSAFGTSGIQDPRPTHARAHPRSPGRHRTRGAPVDRHRQPDRPRSKLESQVSRLESRTRFS
ncbi:SDR family NAD(P)-dependent oxidoreductase [Microtetraspora malaysiensis]|uniref:3beta-hydroxysteroid 3-dehydrogenase n=1 Tax=Microtetraspora malaysiensis TaxID=161358 RepID=A0ABW6T0S0_9ACTN